MPSETKMAKTILAQQAHWLTLLAVAMTMPLLSACLSGSEPVPIRPEVLSDGCGGVIVTWVHKSKIYAKRLNGEGRPLWSGQGMAVSSKPAIPSFHKMVTDDSGGAIIVWMDWRAQDEKGEDLYAQRLSADGRILWKESGVPVCVMPDHQTIADIVSDSSGGVIIVWTDMRNGHREIYAQRLDASGNALWQENGVPVVATGAYLDEIRAASDGSGGAIIVWVDGRGSEYDIYAQRIDSQGRTVWQENGIPMSTAPGSQRNPQMASDGAGGAVIAWYNGDASPTSISAQRVSSEGRTLWRGNGVVLATAEGAPKLINDGRGETLMTWLEMPKPTAAFPGQWALYAQKLNSEGKGQWGEEPVVLSPGIDHGLDAQIASDGFGGTIIVWRLGSTPHKEGTIYAQKLDSKGNPSWVDTGVVVYPVSTFKYQGFPQVVSDGSGGAIIVSVLGRSPVAKDLIYAQRIDSEGNCLWSEAAVQVYP